jgi:hypothetical protein
VLAIDATNGVTVSQNASEGINDTSGSQSTLSLSGGEATTIGSDGSTWWVLSRVTVGGAFSGDHADLTNVQSYQHHAKTTSASDLTDVSADSAADAHHTDPSAGAGLVDEATNQFGIDVVATGTVTLTDGAGTDDTGVSVDRTRYWDLKISPQTAGDVAASLEDDGSTYIVHIEENTTANNPDVGYKLARL